MSGYPDLVVPSFCVCGDHAFAPLSRGYVVLVSPEDAHLLTQKWTALRNSRSAVVRRQEGPAKKRIHVVMARRIMGAAMDDLVDHISGDSTDNRRPNLRKATYTENAWNRRKHRGASNKFKGVYSARGRFVASITANGRRHFLGSFDTAAEAHVAYQVAAERFHGEFARAA